MKVEVQGIEYCTVHGGVMVEGSDDDCQYEELDKGPDEECIGATLWYERDEKTESTQ